jgi:anthranilate/para-aminobenzoate synthase component II
MMKSRSRRSSAEPGPHLHFAGPERSAQAGISIEVLKHFAGKKPILGVCLGHQAIGEAFGGKSSAPSRSCMAKLL